MAAQRDPNPQNADDQAPVANQIQRYIDRGENTQLSPFLLASMNPKESFFTDEHIDTLFVLAQRKYIDKVIRQASDDMDETFFSPLCVRLKALGGRSTANEARNVSFITLLEAGGNVIMDVPPMTYTPFYVKILEGLQGNSRVVVKLVVSPHVTKYSLASRFLGGLNAVHSKINPLFEAAYKNYLSHQTNKTEVTCFHGEETGVISMINHFVSMRGAACLYIVLSNESSIAGILCIVNHHRDKLVNERRRIFLTIPSFIPPRAFTIDIMDLLERDWKFVLTIPMQAPTPDALEVLSNRPPNAWYYAGSWNRISQAITENWENWGQIFVVFAIGECFFFQDENILGTLEKELRSVTPYFEQRKMRDTGNEGKLKKEDFRFFTVPYEILEYLARRTRLVDNMHLVKAAYKTFRNYTTYSTVQDSGTFNTTAFSVCLIKEVGYLVYVTGTDALRTQSRMLCNPREVIVDPNQAVLDDQEMRMRAALGA